MDCIVLNESLRIIGAVQNFDLGLPTRSHHVYQRFVRRSSFGGSDDSLSSCFSVSGDVSTILGSRVSDDMVYALQYPQRVFVSNLKRNYLYGINAAGWGQACLWCMPTIAVVVIINNKIIKKKKQTQHNNNNNNRKGQKGGGNLNAIFGCL